MKKSALIIMIFLCHFLSVHASIINGFLQQRYLLEKEIRSQNQLLNEDNTDKTKRQINYKLKQLQKKYTIVEVKYTETEQFLNEFKNIAPELFAQVSEVTNAEGTLTHVLVRYVNRTSQEFIDLSKGHFVAFAYTGVSPLPSNKNICVSNGGTNTITVTVGKGNNAEVKLAHEFGHVLYMVPNLQDYFEFLHKFNKKLNKFSSGHSPYDPSYAFVESVENIFRTKYIEYKKRMKTTASL